MIINKEYEEILLNVAKNGKLKNFFFNENNKYLLDYLNQRFPMLSDEKYSSGMKIFWLENKIEDFPKCSNEKCNNIVTTNCCNYPNGYRTTHCCRKCAMSDERRINMILKTKEEKYGLKGFNNITKSKKTNIKKYGHEFMSQNIDIIIQSQETKKGRKLTDEEILKLKRLNDYVGKDLTYEDKMFLMFIDDNLPNMKSEKEKYTQKEKKSIRSKFSFYNKMISEWKEFRPLFDVYEFIENDPKIYDFKWKCLKCGNIFFSKFNSHYKEKLRCLKCNPYNHGHSKAEKEMQDFINKLYPHESYYRNTKLIINPFELDDYVKDLKVAFEFDGLYNHSNVCKDDNYHMMKTDRCLDLGIKLIHIFEDEWNFKKEQCMWMIRKNLLSFDNIINSSDYVCREINNNTYRQFMMENDILPYKINKWKYGLFVEDDIVFSCSFTKSKNYGYIMDRFCEKNGYKVIDSIITCIQYFQKYVSENISIVLDRRFYSLCDINFQYKSCDFISPSFSYVNYGSNYRISKNKTDKLFWKNELKTFDDNKTVYENIIENKYSKIYDSGYYILKV